MTRREKVELFEQIRREYEFDVGTVSGVARKFGVHRRMVRQALAAANPPARKRPSRESPKLDSVREFIVTILQADLKAPRKQRHTAHRIFVRLGEELPAHAIAERTVQAYVCKKKLELGLTGRVVSIPQVYDWGGEAQADWYEAVIELDGEPQTLQFFSLRSMASGAAFHRAYLRATQQAFLEARQLAFHYFGGVFRKLRYDNLTSAVKKILRGHRREETERFLLFRSHWQFDASFCNPAKGNEKGGVEGEVGYIRRNPLVPVPKLASLDELNEWLLEQCRKDYARQIGERKLSVGQGMAIEREQLLPLQAEDFDLAEESFCRVDGKGCVAVKTNRYSTPLRVGLQARVRLWPASLEVIYEGAVVARHGRCYERGREILNLEHYLDVLRYKPGAFAGSKPLAQWRAEGRWTAADDQFRLALQKRHGSQAGRRLMIELLDLGRRHSYERLQKAIAQALAFGAMDAAAARYLLEADHLRPAEVSPLSPEEVLRAEYYARPQPQLEAYDGLLATGASESAEVAR